MFVAIKEGLIINTNYIVYYDRKERRLEMSTGEELFVEDDKHDDFLRTSFGEMNWSERKP